MLALALSTLAWPTQSVQAAEEPTLRVGSKRFTESYILGEVLAQAAAPHSKTEHRQGLGNTAIVLAALKSGSIDVYPEYLGTIDQEILKHDKPSTLEQIRGELAVMGLGVAVPLGFNNSYALAVRADTAGVRRLSELAGKPELRLGLSHEFLGRADGWPGLAQRYGLPQQARGLDHGIAYTALAQREVDVIDIYATDAKIEQYGLRVLDDDRKYFPRYDAMLLYRLETVQRFPQAWRALQQLEGRIQADDMIAMNGAAELHGQTFAAIASDWLSRHRPGANVSIPSLPAKPTERSGLLARIFAPDLWTLTRQHIMLVTLSVILASAVGIPLGVVASRRPKLEQVVMGTVGILQTMPSLALLAILISVLGAIGTIPALIALFIYALLPIVRNTCTGITGVPAGLKQAALALGLNGGQRLLHIELPLAVPVILAGVKTAAVMSVGTATIAAFIGAGGYGERITTGLALNDNQLLLAGALPAALLALLTQALFEWLEKKIKGPAASSAPTRLRV